MSFFQTQKLWELQFSFSTLSLLSSLGLEPNGSPA